MRQKISGYLKLLRPANILTALADILAGTAVAGAWQAEAWPTLNPQPGMATDLLWLLLATAGLYGGGVVLNDYFDAELDKTERPERPIPSGQVSRSGAGIWGLFWLIAGVGAAFLAGRVSGGLAAALAVLVLTYDKWAKHHTMLGPVNMGLCRGLNLLLGISILPGQLPDNVLLAGIPLMYIGAITLISRGEVAGGSKKHLNLALGLYAIVVMGIAAWAWIAGTYPLQVLPFLGLFAALIFPPLWRARQAPAAAHVMKAVKAGVISLIAMDAALAAGFAGWAVALLIVCLLPLSLGVARLFAVT